MSLSDYKEKKLLDHANNVAAWVAPTTQYLALFTSDPMDDNTGTQVTTGVDSAYARQLVTFGAATLGTGNCGNTNTITFPAATLVGSAYLVTHIGIFDALTAGNLLDYAPLDAGITRLAGKTLVFAIGSINSYLD